MNNIRQVTKLKWGRESKRREKKRICHLLRRRRQEIQEGG